jgi:RNA polymerase sigma-70 factor (ECF subfamily)
MSSAASPPGEVLELSSVYRRYGEFVWISLQHLGIRPADLEDIAQEAFIVVHRRLHTFDASGQMTTWLFGICMRLASNYRRRRRWKVEVLSGERTDERPASSMLSDELLIRREEREFADRMLNKLDIDKRAVFVLFEIEGLSHAEISSLMNIPVGTVYSRLHAARRKLQKLLARPFPLPKREQE